MRRTRCDFCRGFIENDGTVHKCSERRLKAIERKAIQEAEQELEDLFNPLRTYDDRLQDAEIMMSLEYTNDDDCGVNLEFLTTSIYKKKQFDKYCVR